MATLSTYTFNNMGNLGSDVTDQSQKTVYNTRFTNYTLSNYFSEVASDSHVRFAINQPTLNFTGRAHGKGLSASGVDVDTNLLMKTEQERALEKLQLFERPFLTVPYLGRGSADPTLESQLLQGEMISDKKSTSTIMEKSFAPYSLYPMDSKMENFVNDPKNTVQEAALDGWTRGGAATRDMAGDDGLVKNNRPNTMF
jgi:hypothetical protein